MELDKHKTKVKFYIATYKDSKDDEQPFKEVLAVFVDEQKDYDLISKEIYFNCYVHLGGYSICSKSFLAEHCKKATEIQYKELFNELTNNFGYNLKLIIKIL